MLRSSRLLPSALSASKAMARLIGAAGLPSRLIQSGDLMGASLAIQRAFSASWPFQRAPASAPRQPTRRPASAPSGACAQAPGSSFSPGSFANTSASIDYKLFAPPAAGSRPLPLVVMLHGCSQDPDDFATGTAMNRLASEMGFFVLYPAQTRRANSHGCWNWFKPNHQKAGRGEPALIAGAARSVMASHLVDPDRVFVAGLSAGGSMAAILGRAYPELFAAVGVHSGLAAGSAGDISSALSAMSSGASGKLGASSAPTIVFHGDADRTVHPSNGSQVACASAGPGSTLEADELPDVGGRAVARAVHRDANGRVTAELWECAGAGHAWFGGDPAGSYADARGPDASAEMIRFFMEHPLSARHSTAPTPA